MAVVELESLRSDLFIRYKTFSIWELYRNLGLILGFKKWIDMFNYWLALVPAFPVFKGLSEVLIRQEEAVYFSEKRVKSQNPKIPA